MKFTSLVAFISTFSHTFAGLDPVPANVHPLDWKGDTLDAPRSDVQETKKLDARKQPEWMCPPWMKALRVSNPNAVSAVCKDDLNADMNSKQKCNVDSETHGDKHKRSDTEQANEPEVLWTNGWNREKFDAALEGAGAKHRKKEFNHLLEILFDDGPYAMFRIMKGKRALNSESEHRGLVRKELEKILERIYDEEVRKPDAKIAEVYSDINDNRHGIVHNREEPE